MKRLLCFLLALGVLSPLGGCDSDAPGPARGADAGASPDAAPEVPVCATLREQLEDVIPTAMLLIDRSGSMTEDFGDTSRWEAAHAALVDPDDGVVTALEEEVRFGAAFYSSRDGFDGGACPLLETVPPGLSNRDAIDSLFAMLEPEADTPTGAALNATLQSLGELDRQGPKFVVLATDGMPDSCTLPDPDGHEDALAGAVGAARAAYEQGVGMFVISVGDEVSEEHLQDMANASVGLPLDGDQNASFYRANDPSELVQAMESITDGVRHCTFPLELDLPPGVSEEEAVLGQGRVTLDGRELEEGTEWRLLGTESLELLGPACDELLDGGDHVVEAEFACEGTRTRIE